MDVYRLFAQNVCDTVGALTLNHEDKYQTVNMKSPCKKYTHNNQEEKCGAKLGLEDNSSKCSIIYLISTAAKSCIEL